MAKALIFQEVAPSRRQDTFSMEVEAGLSRPQKTLPSRFFYDYEGSELFEQITGLHEYYLTRSEQQIFNAHATEIIRSCGANVAIVEFGSGSSSKTRLLLSAALERQSTLMYVPIDISRDYLIASARALVSQYEKLNVTALASEYRDAIKALPSHEGPRLILFLGSNIGNFDASEACDFLERLRRVMTPEDRLLVGIDLLKDPAIIELAYNDAAGVTEAFNKNILSRVNRELGGRFDLGLFRHEAPFVPHSSAIEMRLVSTEDQSVWVEALGRDFHFKEGEWIHTESSFKYSLAGFEAMCAQAGLRLDRAWMDEKKWFAVTLLALK